jgi:hypothetical protein
LKELLGLVLQYCRLLALGAPQIDVSALPRSARRARGDRAAALDDPA